MQWRRRLAMLVIPVLVASNVYGGEFNYLVQEKIQEEEVIKFDFGGGKVAEGYHQVTEKTKYSEDLTYGFQDVTKVTAAGEEGDNALKDDYCLVNEAIFNVDLDPGDYKVKLIIGDSKGNATLSLKAEGITKLESVIAGNGEYVEKNFNIALIDEQLTLAFSGENAKVNGMEIYKLPKREANEFSTVYIASDSTVQTYAPGWKPEAGWGQMLERYLDEEIKIDNRAIGGRSSRSFVEEGRLDVILSEICPGDYLFIQWGHNDATISRPERYVAPEDFPKYLEMYVDGAHQRGAIPVLITPVSRRSFNDKTGEFNISFPEYRDKMIETSNVNEVELIDLGLKSKEFLDEFGVEGSTSIFLHVPAGVYDAFPSGSSDDTHFQEFGAIQMARLVSEGITECNSLELKKYVKNIEPPANVPNIPEELKVGKVSSASVGLTWKQAEDADIYYIYRKAEGENEFRKAGTSTLNLFTDNKAEQETTYTYKITAVNGKGESGFSSEVNAITKSPSLRFDFGSPTSPVAEGYTKVAWDLEYNEELGYGFTPIPNNGRDRGASFSDGRPINDLHRDFVLSNPGIDFKVDLANGDYTLKIIAGDSLGTVKAEYWAEGIGLGGISIKQNFAEKIADVRITDGQLNLVTSNYLNGLEITPVILAPTGLRDYEKILGENPSVVLTWNPVEDAIGYNIYRKSDTDETFVKVGFEEDTTFYEQSVNLGSEYTYKVCAVAADQFESAPSNEIVVVMVDPNVELPNPPGGLRYGDITKHSVELSWDAVPNAVVYNVYRATKENDEYKKVGASKTLDFIDTQVTTNIPYYYKIQAVSAGGPSELSVALKTPVMTNLERKMEEIDRAPLAVKMEDGVYIGWRLLITDTENVAFNVYRNNKKINEELITTTTNFIDKEGNLDDEYSIATVINGSEVETIDTIKVWKENYLTVNLNKPQNGRTPLGEEYEFSPNDMSVGDLDGDGEYELIVKWQPSNAKDNSQAGYTGETILDAYKMDGTFLWRIDLGKNIRSGAHYTQFMVYDFDGDGKSELACKTADGTIDGKGNVIGDKTANWVNPSGYILTGPEYLTVFNGETGAAMDTIEYEPGRGQVDSWGDGYGNRVDRFLAAVAYLDGETPSLIMCRGYYTRAVLVAYNLVDGKLEKVWTFDSKQPGNGGYEAQGNHGLSVADVDQDGKDEIVYGSATIDDDGTGLYTTGLGHGDAMHVSDLNPDRPGLEVFQVHEHANSEYQVSLRDAETGSVLWGIFKGKDTGRGVAADIDPRYRGAEVWAIDGAWNSPTGGLYSQEGELISNTIPPANFAIWWDGDKLREIVDHNWEEPYGVGTIGKWDYEKNQLVNLLTAEGTYSCNYTKGTPALQADLFGDWREEIIWRTDDNTAIRIYTTTDYTPYRMTTLMQDSMYRTAVAWQNVGYNQPPHPSFYIGDESVPVELQVKEATSDMVSLTWKEVKNAQAYRIYEKQEVSTDPVRIDDILITQTTGSSYIVTGLEPNTQYTYKVTSLVDEVESAKSLEVIAETIAQILEVYPVGPVEHIIGTELVLPKIVSVKCTDNKDKEMEITWEMEDLNIQGPGEYTIEGIIENYSEKIPLKVIVKEDYIKKIEELESVTCIIGEKVQLPENIIVYWASDKQEERKVIWNIDNVDVEKLGEYEAIGTVVGYEQPIVLSVKVKENYIVSVKPLLAIKVAEGSKANLPESITATYANGEIKQVKVEWDTVDTNLHGTYLINGYVEGYDGSVIIEVEVYDEPSYKFDFGVRSSNTDRWPNGKLEEGYTAVEYDKLYEGNGYGFDRALECIVRTSNDFNDMQKDYISIYNSTGIFTVDLPDGKYGVEIHSGDISGSTKTTITLQGINRETITSKNQVIKQTYEIDVANGKMELRAEGTGIGAINGVIITPIKIDSIDELATIHADKDSEIVLPEKVVANYHNGTRQEVEVKWDAIDIDTSQPGDYQIKGKVEGYEGIVEVRVVVEGMAEYTILATSGEGVSISPTGKVIVEKGQTITFEFTTSSAYTISQLVIDGIQVTTGSSYTFINVSQNHNIHVEAVKEAEKPAVDKSKLQALILEAIQLKEEEYTEATWVNVEEAINKAVEAMSNNELVQEEIDEIRSILEKAINELELKEDGVDVVNKEALINTIRNAKQLIESNYTANSWNKLENILKEAEEMLAHEILSQQLIDEMMDRLQEAIENLVEVAENLVDKNELKSTMDTASKLIRKEYTQTSWNNLQRVVDECNKILQDDEATQEEVDVITNQLKLAIKELAKISSSGDKDDTDEDNSDSEETKGEDTQNDEEALVSDATIKNKVSKIILAIGNKVAVKDEETIVLAVTPYIENNRSMVGIRDIINLLGIANEDIIWNHQNKTVTITVNQDKIEFIIGETYAFINGQIKQMDVAPKIIDEKTVMPIGELARMLGMNIVFNEKEKTVEIGR